MDRIFRILAPLTVVALALALGMHQLAFRQYRKEMRPIVRLASTEQRAQGWIGREFPEGLWQLLPKPATARYRLIWVISSGRCGNCATISDNILELHRSDLIDVIPLVVGSAESTALVDALRSRMGLEPSLFHDDLLVDTFGFPFKSLKLFVRPDGMVLSVDDRPPGGPCQWSYEGQLAALILPGLGLPLRDVPSPTSQTLEPSFPPPADSN